MMHDGGWFRMGEGWDLDGDRLTGGGPAGRRDLQAVQEIIVRSRPACEVNC